MNAAFAFRAGFFAAGFFAAAFFAMQSPQEER
jgi:hypothetical protein